MLERLATRIACLRQIWRATDTEAGYAVWHNPGLIIDLRPDGTLEILDRRTHEESKLEPGEPPELTLRHAQELAEVNSRLASL